LGIFGAILSLSGDTPSSNNEQYVIRGGLATPENLQAGSVTVREPYQGLTGFSVTTSPTLTIGQLAATAQYRNGMISFTTVRELAALGVQVAQTPFPGMPLHGTAVVPIPLSIERAAEISSIFKRIPNPAKP
jgi:hypothetical protein